MRTARILVALAGVLALWACPSVAAAQAPPPDSQFQKVVIDDSPGEPMDLAVLPDGRVLHVTRQGHVWLHDPDTGLKTLAAQLDVYQHDEEGLQNIALDPELREERVDLPVLLAAPGHSRRRPGDAGGQRGRRAVFRHAGADWPRSRASSAFRASSGTSARTPSTSARRSRSSTCRSTAASAATSAGTSSSTPTATCTSRPGTTRTRSSRTATRRSTSAWAATRRSTHSGRRRTRTTCAARSCGSRRRRAAATRSPRGTSSRTTTR